MPGLRPLPLWLVYEVAKAAGNQWQGLPAGDREKLTKLALKSRGLPMNLTARERNDVKRILGKVDLKQMARDFVPGAISARRRGR